MAITKEDLLRIKEEMNKAQEDTTPFLAIKDENVSVIGDANKTEPKSYDYTVRFRFPKEFADKFEGSIEREVGNYIIVGVEYKDVRITPRRDMEILSSIMEMIPFFNKLNDNGSVEDMTDEDYALIVMSVPREAEDAMYKFVESVLDIDDDLGQYMLATSVFEHVAYFIKDFPEVFNEADVFFG